MGWEVNFYKESVFGQAKWACFTINISLFNSYEEPNIERNTLQRDPTKNMINSFVYNHEL